jgi:Endoglucanase
MRSTIRLAALACVVAAALFLTGCSPRMSPIARHGALSVKDGHIVNRHGEPPQLRGISFSWSVWGGKKYYNPEVVNWLVDDFRTTVLRLSMAIEPDSGYLRYPQEQTALIEQVADAAIQRGVYVIIDWHDHNADKNKTEARAFFSRMAQRYAGTPNVIYEVWNEPERQTWQTVKDYAIDVIAEIRRHDPDNLIVVGSPHWDQDVDLVAADPITGVPNIAYAFHFYASDLNHQEQLRAKADAALAQGLPLFITEWGVGEANGDGVFDREKTGQWMAWMERNRLSWANWNLTDKAETTAILKPGARVSGSWGRAELTAAGRYIRRQLRKSNTR